MKNDKKKIGFSPTKKVFSAAAMLAVSASMLATSTYAWFSMNTQVTATGMNVKAKAEGGIVISNSAKSTWSNEADASYDSAIGLFPTSTANATAWYHATSTDADSANAYQPLADYTNITSSLVLSDTTKGEGVGYKESGTTSGFQADEDSCYYLLNKFFIRSSGDDMTGTLYINNVSVESTKNSTASALQAIDAAMRVAVVVDGTAYIYSPVTSVSTGTSTLSPTFSYYVAHGATQISTYHPTETTAGGTGNGAYLAGKNKSTVTGTIPAAIDNPIEVSVYVYFEGEDANCKSNNVSGIPMNNLEVSVTFGYSAST